MKHRFFFRFLTIAVVLHCAVAFGQIKINAGGTAAGAFAEDSGFTDGFPFTAIVPIAGVAGVPEEVYQSERYGNFVYTLGGLPANTSCEVRLHFAEIYWTEVGKRVFNVTINGVAALTDFDIFAEAGATTALVKSFPVTADGGGKIVVEFISGIDNAKVSSLEVIQSFTGNYTAKPAIQPRKGADGAVGAFMNGKLPALNPSQSSTSGGWAVEPAFPGLAGQFYDVMDLLPVPRTNPAQVIIRERRGIVTMFEENPAVTTAQVNQFLNIEDRVSTNHNGGISSFVFHPDFNLPGSPNKDYVYAWYQTIQNNVMFNRLSRFTRNPATNKVNVASELVMIQQLDLPPFDHTGGAMYFDDDGFLVLAIGDLEWTDEIYEQALTVNTMFQSSVIRIDVDKDPSRSFPPTRTLQGGVVNEINTTKSLVSGKYAGAGNFSGIGYYIPNDNPYNNVTDALKEHYAKGVRNPWNMTRDPLTGDLYMFDAGSNAAPIYEEINLLAKGADYGWPYWEGPVSKTYETGVAAPTTPIGTFTLDYWSYNHDNGNGNAIADGEVYRGSALPALNGKMIFSDFGSGRIWSVEGQGSTKTSKLLLDGDTGVSGIDVSTDGETLYVIYYNIGQIYKLKSVGVPNPQPPALLSATGVFSDLATLTPAPGLIPVEPASPLWSDASSKHRWIAIPNDGVRNTAGEKIVFSQNDEWSFPVGSVFVKHFELPFNAANPNSVYRLETRFLVHGPDGYYAFTYKWNDAGTEAYLAAEGSTVTIPVTKAGGAVVDQVWQFPSQAACMDCHQANSGRVLGIKTRSLNWELPYADVPSQNQLAYLNSKGMFTQSLNLAQLSSYITAKSLSDTTASVELRVRSYIDMNCSHCHRPGSIAGRATFDGRMTTPLALASLLDEPPHADALGLTNPKVIKPGDAANSLLFARDSSRSPLVQMPPLGTTVVDNPYVALLSSWINGMTSVPVDSDGDGVPDGEDAFPNNPLESVDTDGDGVGDNGDAFPADPLETKDSDGDGVGDNTVLGPRQPVLALNAGGVAVGSFAADSSFSGGAAASNAATVTGVPTGVPAGIYQSERNGNFSYTFSGLSPASFHRVELHFAETQWTTAGKRKFDVTANGKLVLDNLDLIVAAGGVNKAYVKPVTLKPDSNGNITIVFAGVLDKAKVNGVSIVKHLAVTASDSDGDGVGNGQDAFPNDPLEWSDSNGDGVGDNTLLGATQSIKSINSGGIVRGNFDADSNFTGGRAASVTTLTVTDIPTGVVPGIYRSERYGNFTYAFAGLMPSAYHKLDLHFAEIAFTAPGKRKFDVLVNGRLLLNDFDIFAGAGGAKKAIAKSFSIRADASGKIAIQFLSVVGQAKVNGLSLSKQNAITALDGDGDGVLDAQDAFPADAADWKDSDGDGYGDNADVFPADFLEWSDSNGDGVGDNTLLGATQTLKLINSGGTSTGVFVADSNFKGGRTASVRNLVVTEVPAGVSPAIYRTERNGSFAYTFTGLMPSAYHKLDLHFAEIAYTAAGKRRFDVLLNDRLVLNDFDIFQEAGGGKKAIVKPFSLRSDATGKITVQFTSVVGLAKINGLSLFKQNAITRLDGDGDGVLDVQDTFPADAAEWKDTDGDSRGDNSDLFPTDPLEWSDFNGDGIGDNTVLGALQRIKSINSGGGEAGLFLADSNFTGGSVLASPITATGVPSGVAPGIFRTERNGNFVYTFAGLDVTAYHRIELYFAEIVLTASGKRKFDVKANGKLILNDLDVFAEAGEARVAITKAFTIKPDATGKITIQFTSVVNRAKLSGLSIFKHLPVATPVSASSPLALRSDPGIVDSDEDGVPDSQDAFPDNPADSVDSDGDGVGDNTDLFPGQPFSTGVGKYTLLLPAPDGVGGIGDGYGLLTLGSKLTGQLTLTMGDGTRFVQDVRIVNRSLVVDTVGLEPTSPDTLKGTLAWTAQPGVCDFHGTLQWTIAGLPGPINIQAIGSVYTPGPLQAQLGKGGVVVDLLGGVTDLQQAATVEGNGIVWGLSGAVGIFDPNSGLLEWNVTNAAGKAISIRAVYFEDQNILAGYFDDGIGESGAVVIAPR